MHFHFSSSRHLALLLTLIALLPLSATAALLSATDEPPQLDADIEAHLENLKAENDYRQLTRKVFSLMDKKHYVSKTRDRTFSATTAEEYIENLDSQHNLFLASDYEELEKITAGIHKAVQGRNLSIPFAIYRLRQKRMAQALLYQLELLQHHDFDFQIEEYLHLDRKEAKPFADWMEWRDYWRRFVKNQLLLAILSGSEQKDAVQRLQRRLNNRLTTMLEIEPEDVLASFINTALSQYDPHTSYLPPQEYNDWLISLRTQLEGIGAVLTVRDDYVEVVRLIEGGPAKTSGRLQVGDRIIGVVPAEGDELVDVVGMSLTKVVHMIRGDKGSTVELEVLAQEADLGAPTYLLQLVRAVIPLEHQRANYELLEVGKYGRNWKIGVITLPIFYGQGASSDPSLKTASQDMLALIKEMKLEGVDGLLLDLRNNGGGYLDEAIAVAALFLPPGAFLQVRQQGNRISPSGKRRSRPVWGDEPFAVLVNRLSASASEIVAAAVQDYRRGLVLGTTTFGKGTVQGTYSVGRKEGQLKLTRSKFYRINGGSTQGKGVIPDLLLPAVLDAEKIGEEVIDNALPFDTVKKLRLHHNSNFQPDMELLQALHEERKNTNVFGLNYLIERRELLNKLSEDDRIPLHKEARQQRQESIEQQQLALENKARTQEGLTPFADWDAFQEWGREQSADPDYSPRWHQILQMEAVHILIDHIQNS